MNAPFKLHVESLKLTEFLSLWLDQGGCLKLARAINTNHMQEDWKEKESIAPLTELVKRVLLGK